MGATRRIGFVGGRRKTAAKINKELADIFRGLLYFMKEEIVS